VLEVTCWDTQCSSQADKADKCAIVLSHNLKKVQQSVMCTLESRFLDKLRDYLLNVVARIVSERSTNAKDVFKN